MLGAIIGDIAGSAYEFNNIKAKDFELFKNCFFTDDTVMTCAVAKALLESRLTDDCGDCSIIRNNIIKQMKYFGRKYENVGYGERFKEWLKSDDDKPYNSWGNGSAMRVSAAGWLYDSLELTRTVAAATADVTHNHPDGIKGAEAVASVIYLARKRRKKQEIREYVEREFYKLDKTCDEIRPTYTFHASCQKTVPQAITVFLEGKDFEDVLRTAVSLGGDSDTLTCIACSMAEAYYGIPESIYTHVPHFLNGQYELMEIISDFYLTARWQFLRNI